MTKAEQFLFELKELLEKYDAEIECDISFSYGESDMCIFVDREEYILENKTAILAEDISKFKENK